ncbi:MAG: peptide chain release factor 2, partial [Oscillospiraceae bacterium]
MFIADEFKLRLAAASVKVDSLKKTLKPEEISAELAEIEKQSAEASFWEDTENSKNVLSRQSSLKNKLGDVAALVACREDVETLIEMAEEQDDDSMDAEIEREMKKLENMASAQELATLLSGEYDSKNAILTFHAGAGGTEAQDWVEMLYRMYNRFAASHGFKVKVLDYLDGEEAGIKSASLLIEGHNAYGYLKSENGVHRLVRVSPFDSSGRRHTSFASLEVMPEIGDDVQIEIRDEDLRVDTYRSGGAGGQHVNKTESAIRITHIPTGIVVACQNERSQFQNRDVAMKMLKSKLIKVKEQAHLEKIEDIKGNQMEIAWGSQIRS